MRLSVSGWRKLALFFPSPTHLPAAVTLFLELWKRYQAQLEYEWDTVEFLEQEEPSRPEYEAKCIYERKNPVTGVNGATPSSSP